MIDASHDNSGKDHDRQPAAAADVAGQVADGQPRDRRRDAGVFLVAGRQEIGTDAAPLAYGQSITDACMDWDTTAGVLAELAGAVRARRAGDEDRGPRGRPDRRLRRAGGQRIVPGAEVVGFGRDGGRLSARASSAPSTRRRARSRRRSEAPRPASPARPWARCPTQVGAALAAAPEDCVVTDVGSTKRAAGRPDRRSALRGRPPDRRRGDERGGERPGRAVPGRRLVPHADASAPPGCSTSACTAS